MKGKAQKSVVRLVKAGQLYLMKHDDYRFGTSEYEVVTGGRLTAEVVQIPGNRYRSKKFVGENGKTYAIFSDWSALELEKSE